MRSPFVAALVAALSLAGLARAADVTPSPWLSQPALSPDGREIAFSSGGDLWTVPAGGGEARLLVSHPADDRRPLYSPDGKEIVFFSTRTGNGDLYVLTLATGALRRLTFDDGVETPDAWSADGRWIYFYSTTADIAGMNDVWRVKATGGTPMPVSAERYTNEFASAPSPDGRSLLLCARGIASGQWWRNGHSHLDESEIWFLDDAKHEYRRIVDRGAKSLWPMWQSDGKGFYFMSDRSGAENLWRSDLDGKAAPITRFEKGRVLWPSLARDGRTLAFERDFGLWTLDVASSAAKPVPVTLRGAPAGAAIERRRLTGGFEAMALSPDGKKIAFIVRGEVFAASASDGGEAVRVTRTSSAEAHVAWAPDSRRIAFVTPEDGASHVHLYDFVSGTTTQLTSGKGVDVRPVFSPDSASLAYVRDGHELHVLTLATRKDRTVASARIDLDPPFESARPFAWSRDSRWIGFMSQGDRLFRNASVVEVTSPGAQPIPVSFLANTNSETVSFTPDGTALLFDTGQRTEDGRVARVDLVPRVPRFKESKFRELFEDKPKAEPSGATPATKGPGAQGKKAEAANAPAAGKKAVPAKSEAKPVEVVADGIRTRLALLPVAVDVQSMLPSPDGKQLLLVAQAEGAQNLYLYSLDELATEPAVAKQLTATRGSKSSPCFSPDGKTIYYLDDGGVVSIPVDSRESKPIAISASLDVDFDVEKQVVFDQAWGWLGAHFHDPKMNGADWPAVRSAWAPHVAATRTTIELTRLLSMMVGELNASHLGVAPSGDPVRVTGRLGLRFDRAEYEKSGALEVAGLVPLAPAAVTRKIAVGEVLLAVNGVALTPKTSLEQLLENQVGREVRLTLAAAAGGSGKHDVEVLPVTQVVEKNLIYREWVEKNRAAVDKLSAGRLGYVHMIDMSYESLLRLMSDLDAQNMTREGVVIDVRNNSGGFVNAYALDILSRKHYLNMTERGWPTANARTLLGQRSLEKPTVLLTNQHSLSDAEDFSEGYRTVGLGPIVGEPTAGWIIYTSNMPTIDRSIVRLPSTTITTARGEPMEMHPRPVDIEVRRALGEDAQGRDSQIERAVTELLARVPK